MILHAQARGAARRRRTLALSMVLTVGVLGGCDGILAVELPGSITDDALFQPAQAPVLIASAIADIECAFSDFVATTGGGSEDVLGRTTGWWAGAHEYAVAPNTANCNTTENAYGWYTALHKGRYVAERAYSAIGGWDVPNKERLLAQAAIYSGVVYNLLGDYFCEVTTDKGPLMSPNQTLALGEEYLTNALTHIGRAGDFPIAGGVTTSAQQMALLLRARPRFAQGDQAGALADAQAISRGFMAYATRESTGPRQRGNKVAAGNNDNGYVTIMGPITTWTGPGWSGVIPFTGYRDLGILPDGRAVSASRHAITTAANPGAVADVRVPVLDTKTKTNGHDFWTQQKYRTRDADIPLANWQEAWLIRAEIEGGQRAIDLVNEIRDFHELPRVTYPAPGDTQGIKDMIIEERRRSLFLEGRFYSTKIQENLWFPRGIGVTEIVRAPYFGAVRLVMPQNEFDLNAGISGAQRGTLCGDQRPVL
jgi:hypothetical protein